MVWEYQINSEKYIVKKIHHDCVCVYIYIYRTWLIPTYLFHLWRAPVRAARPGSLPLRVRGLGGSVRFPLLQRCNFPGSCDGCDGGYIIHNEFNAENHSSQKASRVQKLYHVPCDDSSNHSISFYPRVDASAY